jgi:hypothetical protein
VIIEEESEKISNGWRYRQLKYKVGGNMSNIILAIDPGNIESAYVLLDENLKPIEFAKIKNEDMLKKITEIFNKYFIANTAIEMIASYGMGVGREVFETCVWVGRFIEHINIYRSGFELNNMNLKLIYRKEEALNLCNSARAGDSNITQALVDRFAYGIANHGKGTKKNPGWFHGVAKDVWAAIAVGVTYYDLYLKDKGV